MDCLDPGQKFGFLLSVSKSLQEVEDENMLLATLNLGKTLQNGDKTMNRGAIPLLKRYKTEDSSVFNDKNAGNMKFSSSGVCWEESIDLVGKCENYSSPPPSLKIKHFILNLM
ncbi:hypothetical protein HGM15179_016036 [Zosterops borbonicus]|uniref:Uncharacterized protein n=1 Tax=Zosterops borbonicus TaxID=364589 RepID=A0A8K1G3L8_9PASS|nr:hypothetical protein HGM15179_016036 [Zosterops borbonicus]